MALVLPAQEAAAQRAGGDDRRQPLRARPGLPNAFAQDYKIDEELSDRARKNRDPRETADVIVTFGAPGERLSRTFNRYACGPRLDIINGIALCGVPVNRLTALSKEFSIHRVHYNRNARGTDTLSSVAVQADVLTGSTGTTATASRWPSSTPACCGTITQTCQRGPS